jgi:hypothetical protein
VQRGVALAPGLAQNFDHEDDDSNMVRRLNSKVGRPSALAPSIAIWNQKVKAHKDNYTGLHFIHTHMAKRIKRYHCTIEIELSSRDSMDSSALLGWGL